MLKVGFAFVALLMSIWFGRALLAYHADISICFEPMKIVSHQDRMDEAVDFLQDEKRLKWAKALGGDDAVEKLRRLDPKTCCKIIRRGAVGEEAISFRGLLFGETSHGVDTGVRLPHAGLVKIRTPICGQIDRTP